MNLPEQATLLAVQLKRGAELELTVDTLAYGGRGVARYDGLVVFVEAGFPGDKVRAEITRKKSGYAEASVTELLEPSPKRQQPVCLHGDELCPGAPWQVLAYEDQLAYKQQQVADAVERIGGFADFAVDRIVAANQQWRYRNKMEYSFGSDEHNQCVLGFHPRGRWWQCIDVEDCQLASPLNNKVRNFVREWSRKNALEPFDRRSESGVLRNLMVRDTRLDDCQLQLISSAEKGFDPAGFQLAVKEALPEVTSLIWTVNAGNSEVAGGTDEILAGSTAVEEEVCSLRFSISAGAFFQTNSVMAERLFATALEFAEPCDSDKVFDLYSGIGTIGLIFAQHCGKVFGVDIVEQAVSDGIENAELNGISNASFFAGNMRTALRPLVEKVGSADIAVVDPPRAGLSQKVVRRLLETEARKIVYISCNPTTMAPNLRQISDAGYKLERIQPIDMFPQTPHIESVALLTKGT